MRITEQAGELLCLDAAGLQLRHPRVKSLGAHEHAPADSQDGQGR